MKQCPQCNSSCEDNDAVCSNCGYIFPPKGFDPNAFSAQNSQQSSDPSANFNNNPNPNAQYNQNQNPQYNQNPNMNQPYNNSNWSSQPQFEPKNNGMSIASIVLGIVATVFGCCYGIGIIPGIIAVITGFIGNAKIKKSNGTEKGTSLAVTGIVLGFVGILLGVFIIVSIIANKDEIMKIFQNAMNESQRYNYN